MLNMSPLGSHLSVASDPQEQRRACRHLSAYAAARIALSTGTHGRSGSGSRAVRSDKRVCLRVAARAGEHGREKRQMSQCRSQRRPEHDQRRLPE